ncbi:MAG: HPF/RaiA family ribosome-associated protein [Clostridium sp.]|nr:HPF/RaiA family ribosome-associated protein [Clostridium sp.]
METKIQEINFVARESLREFIDKKVERLERHHSDIATLDITMKVTRPEAVMNKRATIHAIVPHIADIVASKDADTFEEALTNTFDNIDALITKNKEQKKGK